MISKVRGARLQLGWWLGLIVSGGLLVLGGLVYAVGRQSLAGLGLMALGLGRA